MRGTNSYLSDFTSSGQQVEKSERVCRERADDGAEKLSTEQAFPGDAGRPRHPVVAWAGEGLTSSL